VHLVSLFFFASLSVQDLPPFVCYYPVAYLLLFYRSPALTESFFPSLRYSLRPSRPAGGHFAGIKPSNGKERPLREDGGKWNGDGINRSFNREPSSLTDEIHINA